MIRLAKRVKKIINSRVLKRWGTTETKKAIWDEEFSTGQWDYLDNTTEDVVYDFLKKYSNNGDILDLGCGSGNTGSELDAATYQSYTGVDVSHHAVRRASTRSEINTRQHKNEYVCADIAHYVPAKQYDIILFRESIFYIPKSKIASVLERYCSYLRESGVFVVRMCDKKKYKAIVRLIESEFDVVERSSDWKPDIILVFKKHSEAVRTVKLRPIVFKKNNAD